MVSPPVSSTLKPSADWLFFACFALVCGIASIAPVATALEFDRQSILTGQWWRVVTCHLTHFGSYHLVTNLLYLGGLVLLTRKMTVNGWFGYIAFAAIVVPIVLLCEPTPLDQYRGMSALLYGLTAWCALVFAQAGHRYLYFVPVLIILFIVSELVGYAIPRHRFVSVASYPPAHLYAVLAALIWYPLHITLFVDPRPLKRN